MATTRSSDPEGAEAEARTALSAFEGLGAGRDADSAAALLRELGVRVPRHWHVGVEQLGLSIIWLRSDGPAANGVDVAPGGQVLAGPGAEPVRRARRIDGVLAEVRGFVSHAVTTGQAPGRLMPLIYELADGVIFPCRRAVRRRAGWRGGCGPGTGCTSRSR